MNLDLWCLLLVGTFGFTGMFQGASSQVARVIAMAGATVIGYWAGPWVGARLLGAMPASVRSVVGGLLLGVVAYLILATLLRRAARRVIERTAWGKADRGFGLVLGSLQGAYLAWILVLCLPMINFALASRGSHLRFHTEGSRVARFAAEHPLPIERPNEKSLHDAKSFKQTLDRFKSLDLPLGNGS